VTDAHKLYVGKKEEPAMRQYQSLIEMVEEGVVPVGMQCFTGDHTLIEVLGATGFDYVWLDSEHSAINPRALEDTMRTCEVAGLIPLVRIPDPDDSTAARRALEAGASAVIVPMVRSAGDVRDLIEALRFPPRGSRGLCPALRVPGFTMTGFPDYMRHSDGEALVIPMIETVEALAEVEEIFAIDEVKVSVLATGELAYAMGELPDSSPKVREAQERVRAVAHENGVALIGGNIMNPTTENLTQALEEGVSIFCLGLDVMAFRLRCETVLGAADAAVGSFPGLDRPVAPRSGFPWLADAAPAGS